MNKKMKQIKILRVRTKKGNFKKKKIPKLYRTAVIVVLAILALTSLYNATATTWDKATTMEQSVPVYSYTHTGNFNYIAYLKNNTVYNFTTIQPGQATIFKQITDHFDMSFNYKFTGNQSTNVTGSYTLIAEIQTEDNLWTRTYTLIPKTIFADDSFNINFELNTTTYGVIVATINNEIGITATNPTLALRCEIIVSTKTSAGFIYDSFTPTLTIPLFGNIIEINGGLLQTKEGALSETVTVNIPEEDVSSERNGSLMLAGVFFLLIIPVALFTQNDDTQISQMDKQIKKIKKKYGEWIVEVDNKPIVKGSDIVIIKTFEDLAKTSEELGKPIIYYKDQNQYVFNVFDESLQYEYILGE